MRRYRSFGFKPFERLVALMAFLLAFSTSFAQSGQYQKLKFDRDKQKHITLGEFYNRVDKANKLLTTRNISAISDQDHVNIIMCLNTIVFCKHTIKGLDKRFIVSKCQQLERVAREIKYSENLGKIYAEIPSRGLGEYFPKLKMELYGTPYGYAKYSVSEK